MSATSSYGFNNTANGDEADASVELIGGARRKMDEVEEEDSGHGSGSTALAVVNFRSRCRCKVT